MVRTTFDAPRPAHSSLKTSAYSRLSHYRRFRRGLAADHVQGLSAILEVETWRLAEIIRGKIDPSITHRLCADELSQARPHLTTVASRPKITRSAAVLSRMAN